MISGRRRNYLLSASEGEEGGLMLVRAWVDREKEGGSVVGIFL